MEKEASDIETTLQRIESKLDRLLYLLGDGRGRSTEELRRKAQADIIRLQNRKARKEVRKKQTGHREKKE